MGSSNSTRVRHTFLVGAAAAVVVGLVVLLVLRKEPGREAEVTEPEPSAIALPRFEYDVEALEREWSAEREGLGPAELGEDEQRLIRVFRENNAQAAAAAGSDSQLAALSELVSIEINHYVSARGPDRFRQVGWHLADEFMAATAAIEGEAERSGESPQAILQRDAPESRSLRESVGNFYDFATESGLVHGQGAPQFDRSLLLAVFRFRWFSFAEAYPPLSLMGDAERIAFLRWRIEAAQGLPLAQRLASLETIEPAYDEIMDPDAVRAVLYYRAGDVEAAGRLLQRAQTRHPDDPRYEAMVREIAEGSGQ